MKITLTGVSLLLAVVCVVIFSMLLEGRTFRNKVDYLTNDEALIEKKLNETSVQKGKPVKCGVYEQDGQTCSELDYTAVFFDNMGLSNSNSKSTSVIHG